MNINEMHQSLEMFPIVASVHQEQFEESLNSPAEIIFLLEGDVMSVADNIKRVHENNKAIFIHIDLLKGIGKDRCGVEFLKMLGADGIISTRAPLIKTAKEIGLIAIQRYFAVDTQGLGSIREMISATKPDFIEIMPGVVGKIIAMFVSEKMPVIASGLIETKAEVTAALSSGAVAVSSGTQELWYL